MFHSITGDLFAPSKTYILRDNRIIVLLSDGSEGVDDTIEIANYLIKEGQKKINRFFVVESEQNNRLITCLVLFVEYRNCHLIELFYDRTGAKVIYLDRDVRPVCISHNTQSNSALTILVLLDNGDISTFHLDIVDEETHSLLHMNNSGFPRKITSLCNTSTNNNNALITECIVDGFTNLITTVLVRSSLVTDLEGDRCFRISGDATKSIAILRADKPSTIACIVDDVVKIYNIQLKAGINIRRIDVLGVIQYTHFFIYLTSKNKLVMLQIIPDISVITKIIAKNIISYSLSITITKSGQKYRLSVVDVNNNIITTKNRLTISNIQKIKLNCIISEVGIMEGEEILEC